MQSMTSLGRVGRILAGSVDASIISNEKEFTNTSMSTNSQPVGTAIRSNSPEVCQKIDKIPSDENIEELPIMSRAESNIVLQGK